MMSFLKEKISSFLSSFTNEDTSMDDDKIQDEILTLKTNQIISAIEQHDWLTLYAHLKNAQKSLFAKLPDILYLITVSRNKDQSRSSHSSVFDQIDYKNEVLQLLFMYVNKGWIDVNRQYSDCYNYSPMHAAIKCLDFEMVEKLLAANANPNVPNNDNATPVHFAAQQQDIRFLNALLKTGKANPNANTINKQTPVHTASYMQRYANLTLLIQYGGQISENVLGGTPLMMLEASEENSYGDVIWDLERNFIDSEGNTLLHRLCKSECYIFTKRLLIEEPDCNLLQALNHKKQTPLHMAAMNACDECLTLVAKQPQVDINTIDQSNFTALAYAIQQNEINCVKILLSSGAKVTDAAFKISHMHLAVEHIHAITILYKSDPSSIHIMDQSAFIPFQHALHLKIKESISILLLLHKKSDSINQKYAHEQTLLHMAASAGNAEAVAELIKNGAEIFQDENGNTPLHLAVINGDLDCVKLFLMNKAFSAGISCANKEGKNASALAENNKELMELLAKYDPKIRAEKNAAFVRKLTSEAETKRKKESTQPIETIKSSQETKVSSKTKARVEQNQSRPKNKSKKNKEKIEEPELILTNNINQTFLSSAKPMIISIKQKSKWRNLLNSKKPMQSWSPGQKILPAMLVEIFWDEWWGEGSEQRLKDNNLLNDKLAYIEDYFARIINSKSNDKEMIESTIGNKKGVNIVGTATINALLSNFGKWFIKTGDIDILLAGINSKEFQDHLKTIKMEDIWWKHSNYSIYKTSSGQTGETLKFIIESSNPLDISFADANNLLENLFDRDFTITGILLDITSHTIVCPQEWLKDLISGWIRCIDEPHKSFTDDFSRKIRALRFLLLLEKFGFKIEPATEAAIKVKQKEAFTQEEMKIVLLQLKKLFMQSGIKRGLELMKEYNLHVQMVTSKTQLEYLFLDNIFVFNKRGIVQDEENKNIFTLLQKVRKDVLNVDGKLVNMHLATAIQEGLELESLQNDEQHINAYKDKIHLICNLLMTGAEVDNSLENVSSLVLNF